MAAHFIPDWEPPERGVDLPLCNTYHPLGYPVRIYTNQQSVLDAATASWGNFEPRFPAPSVELRVAVEQDFEGDASTPRIHSEKHLLTLVAGGRDHAVCDLAQGFGWCGIGNAVASSQPALRFHYLESFVYSVLSYRELTPIQGSCIALDGRGLLLCGPAGCGKTSLAYACAHDGLALVSDDVSFIRRRDREPAVLGRPHHLRFRASALEMFPELKRFGPGFDSGAGTVIEAITAEIEGLRTLPHCGAERVVFLERTSRRSPRIDPLDREETAERLQAGLPWCDDPLKSEHQKVLKRLAARGSLILEYAEPAGAVAVIRDLLE